MKSIIASVFVILAFIQLMVEPGQAVITCEQVDSALAPCVSYLTQGGEPSTLCCNGVRSIKEMAQKPEDKRDECNCMKEAANKYSNLRDEAAQALPDKCGVKIDFPVSRHINCAL
ncbi:unnamed protein product [Ilex paraguariensis]|uniref:Non-specific lipid-transfer protein n=1 Tax=Ilex paraguariensis TaxID=185542 RepID=A0ABC8V5U3_9AQUA